MTDLPYSRLPGPGEGMVNLSNDERVRAGLNTAYIESVAEQVADGLALRQVVEVDFQPGDMTRYALVFTLLDDDVVTVGQLHAWPGITRGPLHHYDGSAVLVSLGGGFNRCYPFNLSRGRGYLSPDYVSEHLLDGQYHDSGVALATLLSGIAARRNV